MRKIKFLAMALVTGAATVTVSCSKDDEKKPAEATDPILGSWKLTARTDDGVSDMPNCNDSLHHFLKDGTYRNPATSYSGGTCTYNMTTSSWLKTEDNTYKVLGVDMTAEFSSSNTSLTLTFIKPRDGKTRVTTFEKR